MSVPRFLPASLACLAGTLALVAPAGAASTWTVNAATGTATWTENTNSAAVPATLSIAPGPTASPADDRLVSSYPITGGGCFVQGPNSICPLGNGTVAYDTIVASFSGNLSPYTINVDLDRPGLRTEGVFTLASGPNGPSGTFDGSATTTSPLITNGFNGVTGGGDDDALSGNDGANTITGGAGNDALTGMKGNDTLLGGPGDDVISPGIGTGQVADGGDSSRDVLSAAGEDGPAVLSLDGAANDTINGGSLTITGIEDLSGSDGDDALTGDAGFNHISGGLGNDTINGGGGGHDVLRGGPGNDTINGRDGAALFSDVACGPGTDTAIVDAADLVDPDCETVDRAPAPAGFVAPSFPGGPTTSTGAPAGSAAGSAAQAAVVPAALTLGLPKSIKRADLRRKGLKVSVAATPVATVTVELVTTARAVRATAAAPKDNVVLARSTKQGVSGARTFTLRPDASLLRGAGSLAVRVTALTAAGVRTVERRALRVR